MTQQEILSTAIIYITIAIVAYFIIAALAKLWPFNSSGSRYAQESYSTPPEQITTVKTINNNIPIERVPSFQCGGSVEAPIILTNN